MEFSHIPVLLNEVINGLNINPDGTYVDGTMGGAGHSYEIIKKLSNNGLLIGVDRDMEALKASQEKLSKYTNVKYIHDNHDNIKNVLQALALDAVDGILLDLGVSSYQIDEKSRGFSYMGESNLDMRMDKLQEQTAEIVVNTYREEELARIIYEYGEEKFSRRIARLICEKRKEEAIKTTKQLADIVRRAIPTKKEIHPEKRTFQRN